jgi:TRAP-type C4-dicarboxylate transport system substrate-binding protein
MISSKSARTFVSASLLLAFSVLASAADTKVLKFATLAPEGSSWMNTMTALNEELQSKTGGAVKFKFYPGGVSGDEKDVVKKVRIGQLHAAGFTGVGLGEIAPETRILDAPWLFKSDKEVDHVYKAFDKELKAAIEKGGYVLLGWTELGPVQVFTQTALKEPEDMKGQKMWVWEGDPIAQAAYQALGVSPIPLSIVDVMSSLQTGLINGVYGPPMGVVALQWFQRAKFIYPVPMARSAGAILLSKKALEGLSPENQKVLLEVAGRHIQKLNEQSRKENEDALKSLQKQGLTVTSAPGSETLKRLEDLGKKARRGLVGKLYSEKLLNDVEKSLTELRSGKTKKG